MEFDTAFSRIYVRKEEGTRKQFDPYYRRDLEKYCTRSLGDDSHSWDGAIEPRCKPPGPHWNTRYVSCPRPFATCDSFSGRNAPRNSIFSKQCSLLVTMKTIIASPYVQGSSLYV